MSKADVERFVADLKANPDLLAEVKESAGGLASVVEIAKGKGYDIGLDEAKTYIQAQAGNELSDEQLDAIAGGKGGLPGGASPVAPTTSEAAVAAVVVTTLTDGGGGTDPNT